MEDDFFLSWVIKYEYEYSKTIMESIVFLSPNEDMGSFNFRQLKNLFVNLNLEFSCQHCTD